MQVNTRTSGPSTQTTVRRGPQGTETQETTTPAENNTTATREFIDPVYANMGSNPNMTGMSIAGRRALRDKMALAKLEQRGGAPNGRGGGNASGDSVMPQRTGFTPGSVGGEQLRSMAAQSPGNTGGFTYGGPRPGGMLPQGPIGPERQGEMDAERQLASQRAASERMTGFMNAMRRSRSTGVGLGSNSPGF